MLRICLSIFALAACLSVQALAQAAAPSAKPQADETVHHRQPEHRHGGGIGDAAWHRRQGGNADD